MAEDDDWEPAYIPPRGTQWKDAWTPIEPGEEYVPPEPRPESLPPEPEPRTLRSRPWAAAGYALGGVFLASSWWGFWWEAGNAIGNAIAEYAGHFLFWGIITCVYLFALWRWLFRR